MISPADILLLVKTQDEANEFQKQIDHLLSVVFTNIPFEKAVQENISFNMQSKLFALFSREQVNQQQVGAVQLKLQEVKKVMAQLPVLTMSLSFEPKQQLIESIETWVIAHTKKPVLLHIIVDKSLIGGAVIAYKGILKDYSLKKVLQDKYEQGDITITA